MKIFHGDLRLRDAVTMPGHWHMVKDKICVIKTNLMGLFLKTSIS